MRGVQKETKETMSYCRMGPDSDVYLYPSIHGYTCCSCRLAEPRKTEGNYYTYHPDHVLSHPIDTFFHLLRHRETGHKVPEQAFNMLIDEIVESEAGIRKELKKDDKKV